MQSRQLGSKSAKAFDSWNLIPGRGIFYQIQAIEEILRCGIKKSLMFM